MVVHAYNFNTERLRQEVCKFKPSLGNLLDLVRPASREKI